MSKKYLFGVPNIVFVLILLGTVASILFSSPLVLVFIVPIFGYYIWQVRAKNKELEERLAALEGHKPGQA